MRRFLGSSRPQIVRGFIVIVVRSIEVVIVV